jgi:hypothetical protein
MNTTNNLENFTLPKMWMIKVYGNWDNNIDIYKWRKQKWQGSGFITYNKYWYDLDFIDKDFTEITLEQFKKYVLKEETTLDDLPIIGDGVLMEVSANKKDWYERFVFGKSESGFLAWYEYKSNINLWQYARPITPKTKITRKEFESKFEIID